MNPTRAERSLVGVAKRALDMLGAALLIPPALVVSLPLLALIRLESRGAPVFVQRRVGRAQRPFRLLKLRTMTVDTPHLASHLVGVGQITRIGRILRSSKLDELPQLWNVLVGDMSFVGPRPCLPSQTDLIAAREDQNVFAVRPGITGSAQVRGVDMSQVDRLAAIDGDYARSFTLWGDLKIGLQTLTGAGSGDAARQGPPEAPRGRR